MKQYFSENLKKLRRKADITQDKLAEFIGVSPQTVSKWERAETYPDIETLPILSGYFGVTIDELLGNDRMRTEEEIDRLIENIKITGLRDESGALALAREGYRKYPYSYKMLDAYSSALSLYCPGKEVWEKEYKAEVRRIAKLVLEECTDDNLRYSALEKMCSTCSDREEYRQLCERIPDGFHFTRELWLEDYYKINTEEGLRLRQKNTMELMWWFLSHVETLCGRGTDAEQDSPKADTDTWIAACEMQIAVYKGIFCDGDYIEFSWNMAWVNYHLAEAWIEKGEYDKVFDCLEQVAEYTAMHEALPSFATHTSYLASTLTYDESQMCLQGSCGSPEYYLKMLKAPQYDAIRDTPRFSDVVHRLETCKRNLRIRDEKDFEWLK